MTLDQDFVDALSVQEDELAERVARELHIRTAQVTAVRSLLKEGCTVPFIARYRKEAHHCLDEVLIRDCERLFHTHLARETRRLEIIRAVFKEGMLTPTLYEHLRSAPTLAALEDLWAPFKKKKKTRGMQAIEKGLEPLARLIETQCATQAEIERAAAALVAPAADSDRAVSSAQDAIAGACDILAEETAHCNANRAALKSFYLSAGVVTATGIGDAHAAHTSVYQMYWDYAEAVRDIKAHRVLAINRGEREGILDVKITVDLDAAVEQVQEAVHPNNRYHRDAITDGVVRLLSPAVLREIRADLTASAEQHGINVFSENLTNLLMTQPVKGTRVLGIDPGIRTGTKCAALDETGQYLGSFVIYPHNTDHARAALTQALDRYRIQLVAVGNGTGSHAVQELIASIISETHSAVAFTVVEEDGASVYSAGDIAREEFPDLDLTIRGAISIGRRLQDPLAELVKIDPKSIGVGLYQHDVNQKKLSEELHAVVDAVVNSVGVNLNTASVSLLKHVSGVNSALAKRIVHHRATQGIFTSREQLKTVSGMGQKNL